MVGTCRSFSSACTDGFLYTELTHEYGRACGVVRRWVAKRVRVLLCGLYESVSCCAGHRTTTFFCRSEAKLRFLAVSLRSISVLTYRCITQYAGCRYNCVQYVNQLETQNDWCRISRKWQRASSRIRLAVNCAEFENRQRKPLPDVDKNADCKATSTAELSNTIRW